LWKGVTKMNKRKLFADRLKFIGCTQKELSEKAKVSTGSILKYARNRASVHPDIALRIENALDVLYKEKLYSWED